MHRTKMLTVVATAAALLMAAGVSSALAAPADKVTICHATGSQSHPFQRINVSQNAQKAHEHHQHMEDEIVEDDDNNHECDTTPPDGEDHEVTVCHFVGGNPPFVKSHFEAGDDSWVIHITHDDDRIFQDDDGDVECPPAPPVDEEDDENCNAESTSGDSTAVQRGLVNVGNVNLGLDNLASNLFCQSSLLNHVNIPVLSSITRIGGGDGDSGDEGCTAESNSGNSSVDQVGLINLGNANVNAANLAANAFCQAEILNYLNVAVLSTLGTSSFGGGGLLGGPGFLLSGLTADVEVLARVLVLF